MFRTRINVKLLYSVSLGAHINTALKLNRALMLLLLLSSLDHVTCLYVFISLITHNSLYSAFRQDTGVCSEYIKSVLSVVLQWPHSIYCKIQKVWKVVWNKKPNKQTRYVYQTGRQKYYCEQHSCKTTWIINNTWCFVCCYIMFLCQRIFHLASFVSVSFSFVDPYQP